MRLYNFIRKLKQGKQVQILCEPVAVSAEYLPKMPLRNREGGSYVEAKPEDLSAAAFVLLPRGFWE